MAPMNDALPPELLIEIFLKLTIREDLEWLQYSHKYSFPFTKPKHFHYDPSRDLRRVSHVCQYWRDVAVNTPKLWSRAIDCNNMPSKWFNEAISRSQDAPLFVTAGRTHPDRPFKNCSSQNTRFILRSTAQIVEFHADFSQRASNSQINNALLEWLGQPVPSLTRFTLHNSGSTKVSYTLDSPTFNLFGGSAPRLREMTFHYCFPRIKPELLQPLTHLCFLGYTPGVDWLGLLQHTPCLQRLTLSISLPGYHDVRQRNPAPSVVHLSYLTHFTVYGDYLLANQLFTAVIHPPLTGFTCHLQSIPAHSLDPDKFFDTLRKFMPTNHNDRNKTTFFLDDGDMEFRIVIGNEEQYFHVDLIEIGARWLQYSGYILRLMDSSFALFPSCNHLAFYARGNDMSWLSNRLSLTILSHFADTATLSFTRIRDINKLLGILGKDVFRNHSTIVLPDLRKLILSYSIEEFGNETDTFLDYRIQEGHPIKIVSFLMDPKVEDIVVSQRERKLVNDYQIEVEFHKEDDHLYETTVD